MGNQLEKQQRKLSYGPKNNTQKMRLKREFEATYKRKVVGIRQALKPVKYRNRSQEMGYIEKSDQMSIKSEISLDSYREESMSIGSSASALKANNS